MTTYKLFYLNKIEGLEMVLGVAYMMFHVDIRTGNVRYMLPILYVYLSNQV